MSLTLLISLIQKLSETIKRNFIYVQTYKINLIKND